MKTKLGEDIHPLAKGIIYICKLHRNPLKLEVKGEFQFLQSGEALICYAEIPNPESQIATGNTHEQFCQNLEILHIRMDNEQYLKMLEESI